MMILSETELKKLIQGGETNTVELKVAAPRAVEMAERLCGLANAQGGMIILGVKDAKHEIVGIPDHRIGEQGFSQTRERTHLDGKNSVW